MPALRIGEGSELAQQPEPFKNEYELQEILAGHPVLLVDRGDSALITVSREFPFEGGFADIFLIDNNGLPVIVEVKLARNEESRREVIGQLCDYLSAMRNLTPDEVNARSAGLLEEKLQSMAGIEGEQNPEDRLALMKSNVASYLRAGQIRGIIVLDTAPDDLIREFSYLNEHSDLDLRLLAMLRIGEIGWIEKDRPACGPRDAIVKPLALAPCTSDIHTVWEGAIGERHNMILGHEAPG